MILFQALKALRARPLFSLTAIVTLALGVGFNALVFSLAYGLYLGPLPFPDDGALVSVQVWDSAQGREIRATPAEIFDWQEAVTTLSELGAYTASELHISSDGRARRVPGATVTRGFFEALAMEPILGRPFRTEDFEPGPLRPVLISESYWRRELGGDPAPLDQQLQVTGRAYRIVGVMPDAARLDIPAEVWVPMAISRGQASRDARFLSVIGRRASGVEPEAVSLELSLISSQLASRDGEAPESTALRATPLRSKLLGELPEKVTVLWGAVASVLLMLCANLSLLVLSDAARRQGEYAVRLALGAERHQVAALRVAEMVLLAVGGGLLGLALAQIGLGFLAHLAPGHVFLAELELGSQTLLFTLGLSALVGLALGGVAFLRLPKQGLREALKGQGRGPVGKDKRRLQKALVVAEVAITVVLAMACGLMLRSLHELSRVDTGYEVESISTISVLFPPRTYAPGSEEIADYLRRAVETLGALPGVESVASGFLAPLQGTGQATLRVEGMDGGEEAEVTVVLQPVSSTYFDTMGLDVTAGRAFATHERQGVALANQALASVLEGARATVGHRLAVRSALNAEPLRLEMIGVVESERLTDLARDPLPTLYVPHELELFPLATLYIRRAAGSSVDLAQAVEPVLADLDPAVATGSLKPMETILREALEEESAVTMVLGLSSAIALGLALMGVFGIWTLYVRERRKEFGIRASLGARPSRLLGEVLAKNLKLTGFGLALGSLLAILTSRVLEGWLFKIESGDPATLLGVIVLLAGASMLATWIPAWRASRGGIVQSLRDG